MATQHDSLIDEIFAAFGGPKRLADAIGAPIQTVCDWRAKGKAEIPPWRRASVLDAARVLGADLSPEAAQYLASSARAPRKAAA